MIGQSSLARRNMPPATSPCTSLPWRHQFPNLKLRFSGWRSQNTSHQVPLHSFIPSPTEWVATLRCCILYSFRLGLTRIPFSRLETNSLPTCLSYWTNSPKVKKLPSQNSGPTFSCSSPPTSPNSWAVSVLLSYPQRTSLPPSSTPSIVFPSISPLGQVHPTSPALSLPKTPLSM